MARKMTEWHSKRGPITKIMLSDGGKGDTAPLALELWYDSHEVGWHLGNVGFDIYIALGFGVLSYFIKRYNIPTTPLVLGLILGPLMERFFLTSLASYVTPAEFLLRPRTAVIMGIAFLFLFWSLWPSIKKLIRDVKEKLKNRSRAKK